MTDEPEQPTDAEVEATEVEQEAGQASVAEAKAEEQTADEAETANSEPEAAADAVADTEAEEPAAVEAAEQAEPEDEQPADDEQADEEVEPAQTTAAAEPARRPELKRLLGRKVGMTQIFDDTGAAIPVTLIEAGPCYITQIRRHETDGYNAVQMGFGEVKPKRLTGGQLGHLKRNGLPNLRHLREFRLRRLGDLAEGDQLTVSVFSVGDVVDVVGTSKGRGFAGAIKRHGFHRGPKTHGQSDRERAPGSHGSTSTPGRVFKGSRGPGHMGSSRVSSQNLQVHLVDAEHNLLGVRGSVPGPKGGLVMVKEGRKQ